jgi:hypothetical protein
MQQRNDGMAVAALVLGLCGFIPWLGFVCSILAVIFGFVSLGNIKKNPNLKGHGMAVAGIVLGFALPVLGIIVFVVVFALASRLAHGV